MHAELPPDDDSDHDAVERMMLALPVATLPPAWRAGILSGPPLPPPAAPFFTKGFAVLMACVWGPALGFHLATPAPPPPPEGSHPSPPGRLYPAPLPPDSTGDPWFAQSQHHHIPSFP